MTIAADLGALFAGYDAKIAAGDAAQASLKAAQSALASVQAADAADKAALASANTALAKAQTALAAMTTKEAADQVVIAKLTAAQTPTVAPASASPSSDTPAQATGMKLVFEDDFAGPALDLTKWFPGPKPDGGQWGGAYLVPAGDPAFADAYHVEGGVLRLRARYDASYQDPQNYGRKWRGAEISTAFPDGHASAAVRKGYFEARMKLPYGTGAWAAWWMLNLSGIKKPAGYPGDVEIDTLESYGQWIRNGGYLITVHDYGGPANVQFHSDPVTGTIDLGADFHDYGQLFTATEVAMFIDGKEICRAPLPKAATIDSFYALLDMNIDNDASRSVAIPASGTYDLLVERVRIWDAAAT